MSCAVWALATRSFPTRNVRSSTPTAEGAGPRVQFALKGFATASGEGGAVAEELVDASPEAGAVVHLVEVGELVANDVVRQRLGREHQPEGEIEVAETRATAPARTDVLDSDAVEANVEVRRDFLHHGRDDLHGAFAEQSGEDGVGEVLYARRTQVVARGQEHYELPVALATKEGYIAVGGRKRHAHEVAMDTEVVADAKQKGRHADNCIVISV